MIEMGKMKHITNSNSDIAKVFGPCRMHTWRAQKITMEMDILTHLILVHKFLARSGEQTAM